MANPTVEKIKTLGLRHGEKAVVVLAAALCVLFLVAGITQPTIELKPEQVKKAADAASANLSRPQDQNDILKKLEDQFLKKPEFEVMVDQQAKNLLLADNYKPEQLWVTNEPTGGLIRDMPELIAPTELYAYPGRGGFLMFALDSEGNRVPDTEEKSAPDTFTRARRGKKKAKSKKAKKAQAKAKAKNAEMVASAAKALAREKERLKKSLASTKEVEIKEKEEDDDDDSKGMKEVTVGKRWVAITGTIDHKKLRDNYYLALKRPEQPNYKRLDVERQVLQPDGTWSDWENVNADENYRILDNLPELEEELTPEDVRLEMLVDPLPFLKSGYWERVHIASLVPEEKKEVEKPVLPAGGAAGMMGGSADMTRMSSMGAPGAPSPASMTTMNSTMMGMGAPGMSMPSGSAEGEEPEFPTSEAETLMLRSLDFSVEPDVSYRYRVRIVLYNPNKDHEDVTPGLDTTSKYLQGPWSEATEAVSMPTDITTYAYQKPRIGGRPDQIRFQVAKWNPEDGAMVVKSFDAAPGQIVGEPFMADIPVSDGSGIQKKKIDFNSHQIVLDTTGGTAPPPASISTGAPFETPALSLLVRSDGALMVRNQANDVNDPVRLDIDENYKKEVKDSSKKRESSMGQGSSMMQMMMGGGSGSRAANLPGQGAAGSGYR